MEKFLNRRRVLKGALNGAAVSLPLPFLDCFLNSNGSALANTGVPLPPVFGSWTQNLGFTPGRWKPSKVGANFELGDELKALEPFKREVNLFSGMKYFLEGRPMATHTTGLEVATMGSIPVGVESDPSIDTLIADVVGVRSRFRSLEVSLNGSRDSWSRRKGGTVNPSEPSPVALYARVFGPEFKDPNEAEFKPDPKVMTRRSVLSVVKDERLDIMKRVGSADRDRLEEYFTSLRQIEQQLDIELREPIPLKSCGLPEQYAEAEPSVMVESVERNNQLFSDILAHAIACGQTQVVNIFFHANNIRRRGWVRDWHNLTHEEPIDPDLGYQKDVAWFVDFGMTTFANFIGRLADYREGDGSVLDRVLLLWQTDHGYAMAHTMDDIPILVVGSGGGRIKTGMHLSPVGDPTTRVGLTLQQAMGVPINTWGRLSNETSRPIAEILA